MVALARTRKLASFSVTAGLAVIFALAWIARPAMGADPALHIDPADLTLSGRLTDGAITGLVTLVEAESLEVTLVPGDFLRTSVDSGASSSPPPLTIDASAVTLEPAQLTLKPNIPQAIKISVKATEPGTYTGSIRATIARPQATAPAAPSGGASGPIPSPVTTIPATAEFSLTVVAVASPHLDVTGDKVTNHRVGQPNALDRLLAWLFLDPSETSGRVDLAVQNPSIEDVRVAGISAAGIDEATGSSISAAVQSQDYSPALTVAARDQATLQLPLAVFPESGHYVGNASIAFDGESDRQSVPLDLTIRDSPTWALILLLAGLAGGALVRWSSSRGDAIAAAVARRAEVAQRIEKAHVEPPDAAALREELQALETDILEHPDVATGKIDDVADRLAILVDLQVFAETHPDASAGVQTVRDLIHERRTKDAEDALHKLQDAAGKERIAEVSWSGGATGGETSAVTPNRGSSGGLVKPVALVAIIAIAIYAASSGTFGFSSGFEAPSPSTWLQYGALIALGLIFLARGTLTAWLERKIGRVLLARQLVRVAIDVGLVVVGMRLLYVDDANAILGGQLSPILQYVLWGVGSDISAQALSKVHQ